MTCCILLLFILTSCVCGMIQYRYMGLRYQAEEGSNITVEWSFSSRDDISIPSLKIHCVSVSELKVFYHQDSSVDESLHEQFAGRVQCDRDALRTGRVRLHLSRVSTNDSGLYLCRMLTEFGRKVKQFSLNITAADEPKPVTSKPEPEPPETPEPAEPAPEGQGRICLYVVLGLVAAAVTAVLAASCWTSSHTCSPRNKSYNCTQVMYKNHEGYR
ncbi:uncharacterized protein LOC142950786 isoform X2 [Anarhichas minor]|uniref:uncharacterized protein LOC142950786 isoform X2 n=1 Tax=Anarhichas minor TaxID=65739 RepID=UPI003F739810